MKGVCWRATCETAAVRAVPGAVAGVSHCDRNLFAGDAAALYRFWNGHPRSA